MPVVSARSASKNMSKSKRAIVTKNATRVSAAIKHELDGCTFGKVIRACGNKMFIIATKDGREHLAHIRGKMARVTVNDIVLLGEREYESRAGTDKSVFDIMAIFSMKDASKLVKSNIIPSWFTSSVTDTAAVALDDIFDYSVIEEEQDGESDNEIDINCI